MRTHVLQTYVHQIYDKSDAVTTFATVMNYQICDAHSAASYMCIVHLSCGKYMCKDICVCVSAPHSAAAGGNICWSGEDSSGSMRSSAFFISFNVCQDVPAYLIYMPIFSADIDLQFLKALVNTPYM